MRMNAEYMAGVIEKTLVGCEIVNSCVSEDLQSFGFVVRRECGRLQRVWVDCDAEGNGPGWLSIDPELITEEK